MATALPDVVPVLVFTRAPVPGQVKTRLIPVIGAERAAGLHRAMLWRAVSTAVEAGVGPVELWCTPTTDHPCLRKIQREFHLDLVVQRGADLGVRMHRALAARCADGIGAVLIGSDCPFLESADLKRAARGLRQGADAVIGPAEDGGYYLIGVRRSDSNVFSGIEWGSGRVLEATRARFRALGWQWRELAARRDVDRPGDLAGLEALLRF